MPAMRKSRAPAPVASGASRIEPPTTRPSASASCREMRTESCAAAPRAPRISRTRTTATRESRTIRTTGTPRTLRTFRTLRAIRTRRTTHLLDALPLGVAHRHHREPRHTDERERRERLVGLDLGQRDRACELLSRDDVDDEQLLVRIGGNGIRVARRLGDGDDGFLLPRVIVEDAIAAPDGPQVLLRERIPDPRPHGLPVALELIVGIVLRLFLHEPLGHAADLISCPPAAP